MIKGFQLLHPKGAAHLFAAMTYNFYLKKEPDKKGLCPIYLNVRVNGERDRIPVNLKVHPDFWCKENRIVTGGEDAVDFNLILKQEEARITNIMVQHRLSEIPLTLEKFIDQFKNAPPSYGLVQFFNHIIDIQDLSDNTVIKHKGIINKITESKFSSYFPDINMMWFDKYRAYMRGIPNDVSTVNTNISVIKRYMKLAKDYGIKIYVDLDKVKVGPTAGRIVWLRESEIIKLEAYYYSEFIPDHLKMSLGYFLFSCYTGLRISDVLARTRVHVEADLLDFISIKTKVRQLIAINDKCRAIIEYEPRLFIEWTTEVNISRNLKAAVRFLSIRKNVSFHVARHSFATNYLLKGGKVENLQKLLGHSKITTTMKYVHVVDEEAAMTVNVFDK